MYATLDDNATAAATLESFYASIDSDGVGGRGNGTFGSAGDTTATFTVTNQPLGTPTLTSIDIVSGDGQTGVALNRAAPDPLVVIVR